MPPRRKATTSTRGKGGRTKSGLMSAFASAFKNVNGDAFNAAYGNTGETTGGPRWTPPPGSYFCSITKTTAAEQEELIRVTERDGKDPSVMFFLPLTIVQADDPDLVGESFNWGHYLNPWTDPDTGLSTIIAAQKLKGMCRLAFDDVPDSIEECCAKLLNEGTADTWEIDVEQGDEDKYPEYTLQGKAPEAEAD